MKINKCKLCGGKKIQALGSQREFVHIYCPDCKGHYWKTEWWDLKRWNDYVNGIEYNLRTTTERILGI